MAASQMYSSTPTPINITIKTMASTGQGINTFFDSKKDTKYKKIEGYKDPEKYLGKVLVNPKLVGREYEIKFEKETITQPYMWFNDRIVEIEPPENKTKLSKSVRALNKGAENLAASTSTALEASVPVTNENNWVQVKKRNKQNKGTFGGKSKRTKRTNRQIKIKSKKIKRLLKRRSIRY